MRRPIRPFTVERKRGARPTPLRDPGSEPPASPVTAPILPEPRAPGGANWAAAEALFRGAGERKADAPGRILQSLVEPPAPEPEREPEPPVRRGRKPGSRNKPKTPEPTEQSPTPAEIDLLAPEEPQPAARPNDDAEAAPAVVIALHRRGRLSREDLPRGERWKARLPRFARQITRAEQ